MQDRARGRAGHRFGLFRLLGIIRRTSPASRRPLIEAIFCLLAARVALACLPFHRLLPWCSRSIAVPEVTGPRRSRLCAEVREAIHRVVLHLPGRTACFPRAIAAQTMLRRRGVGTVLYYGASRQPKRGLVAHVWLQDGEEGVIGHRAAGQYQVLARYSSCRTPCSE